MKRISRTKRRINKLKWAFGLVSDYSDNYGIKLPTKHPLISKSIQKQIFFSEYEAKEVYIIHNRISPDDIIMEVGSGIGYLSALCATIVGENNVFTYEANPELIDVIKITYQENNIHPKVINALLAKGNGTHTFYVEKDYWASSSIEISKNARKISVPQKDLNSELNKISPTFLIVDIEGGEKDFFKEADLSTVNKIYIETHPEILSNEQISSIFKKLFSYGFHLDFSITRKNVFFLYR
jgi:FkbM family methyltransferase